MCVDLFQGTNWSDIEEGVIWAHLNDGIAYYHHLLMTLAGSAHNSKKYTADLLPFSHCGMWNDSVYKI